MTPSTTGGGCCAGDEVMGDPQGMHAFDCPVYQDNVAAVLNARREGRREQQRIDNATDPMVLAYTAGYRRGRAECRADHA